jgi:superfamily II DNA or RNA helicase
MKKRVTIEVLSNVRCRMTGAPRALLVFLDKNLAEIQKGSEWSPTHRRFGGRWDGKKHHLLRSPSRPGVGTFAKGLLRRVLTLCAKKNVRAKIIDLRTSVFPPIDTKKLKSTLLKGVTMAGEYSYQLDAVKAALEGEAGVLYMATNAGKTEIASAITKVLSDRTVLFVVPKAILLKQTRERLALRLGTIPEAIGVIGGGKFDPKEVTVAIINSVTPAKRARSARAKKRSAMLREYLKTVECVFLDEGHHAKANTWFRLMTACVNAQYRYLMSGTPFTGDNDLMIEAAAGPVLYEIRNDDLIKLGVSAKPSVRLISIDKPDLERKDALDDESYHSVYTAGIVENDYRNRIIAREAVEAARAGKTVLVLLTRLAQGENITDLIKSQGRPVRFAHGKMSQTARDEAMAWFVEKPGRILVGSNIFDEGVDVPSINVLIVADGGKSLRATLQKIGRSIRRKKTGENVVEVLDFADCTHHWLAKHALDRFDIYTGEGFDVVEEDPNHETRRNERKPTPKARATALSALSRKADGRGFLLGEIGQFAFRDARRSAEQGADELSESESIMRWRWRFAA